MDVSVKHGAAEHRLSLPDGATVGALKDALEGLTALLPRQQKLIFKGKVLEDLGATLSSCKVASGAKLMLLGMQGPALPGRAGGATAAAASSARTAAQLRQQQQQQRAAAAGGSTSTSLLESKMADAAKQQQQQGRGGGLAGLPERRAAWSKTGIVALRDLQLASLPCAWLEGLLGVRSADLSHNRLAALPPQLAHLASLATLKATHNQLQDAGMPWIQLCGGCSSSSGGLAALASLCLGHNQLTSLPQCLAQLTGLTHLDLAHNALAHIEPGALEGLARLEVLQLQGNRLQQLPPSLGSCSGLVALNASHNALAELPDSITRLARLQVLAVDANRLRALPPQLLSACSSLCTLAAHQNPITVEDLRAAEGYAEYEARRQARASKQLGGRVMADTDRAFSEGADVEQWQRWVTGPAGLGSDGAGRAGKK